MSEQEPKPVSRLDDLFSQAGEVEDSAKNTLTVMQTMADRYTETSSGEVKLARNKAWWELYDRYVTLVGEQPGLEPPAPRPEPIGEGSTETGTKAPHAAPAEPEGQTESAQS